MSVESVTDVKTLQGVQEEQAFRVKQRPAPQADTETAVRSALALGVQAVKRQAKVRTY
ncbi:MAG: hypothetical protein NVS3B14_02320 [Ktedonobacteraceae bacterium]